MDPATNYHRIASPKGRLLGADREAIGKTMNARFRNAAIDILVLIELPLGSYRCFGGPTHA
jgi:hypothetical protein